MCICINSIHSWHVGVSAIILVLHANSMAYIIAMSIIRVGLNLNTVFRKEQKVICFLEFLNNISTAQVELWLTGQCRRLWSGRRGLRPGVGKVYLRTFTFI